MAMPWCDVGTGVHVYCSVPFIHEVRFYRTVSSRSGLIGTLQTQKCTKPWAVSYEGRQLPNSTLYFKLSVDNNYQHLIKLAEDNVILPTTNQPT
jgi:hypothetical protein